MYKTKFILFGIILLIIGLTVSHFRYDLVETMSIPINKGGSFDSCQIWIWIIEIISVCADLCGVLSIIYGFISDPKA